MSLKVYCSAWLNRVLRLEGVTVAAVAFLAPRARFGEPVALTSGSTSGDSTGVTSFTAFLGLARVFFGDFGVLGDLDSVVLVDGRPPEIEPLAVFFAAL